MVENRLAGPCTDIVGVAKNLIRVFTKSLNLEQQYSVVPFCMIQLGLDWDLGQLAGWVVGGAFAHKVGARPS